MTSSVVTTNTCTPIVQFCVDHGGFLLELTSDKQEAVLDYFLQEEICLWIGLSDIAQEGMDGSRALGK